MPFIYSNGLRIFQFETFLSRNLIHGIFTRQGGVSPKPWDTLNVGSLVGDDPKNVLINRDRSLAAFNRKPESLYEVWQVHSSEVVVANDPRDPQDEHMKADAIITANPNVTVFMRFADCVPIMLYDTDNHICGMVHSGWEGTVKQIVVRTIDRMKNQFGSKPVNIIAGIGPSIGPGMYEIGPNVIEKVNSNFDSARNSVLIYRNGSVYFDLWESNKILLHESGVESIEVAGICTASNPVDWFSYRGEKGKTGRFGALVGLK